MIVITNDTTANMRIDDAKKSSILESVTGADIMISPITIPVANAALIKKHVSSNAILVQQKNGLDLTHSATNHRLYSQLARMHECGTTSSAQRVILFVGKVEEKNGKAFINDVEVGSYWVYRGIVDSIMLRGGHFVHLPSLMLVPTWLKRIESVLTKINPISEIYLSDEYPHDPPLKDDPFQLPIVVKDWRRILATTVPGLGAVKVNALRDTMLAYSENMDDTLLQALTWATDNTGLMPKIPGWGDKTIESVRQAVGLGENTTAQISTYWIKGE